MGATNVVSPGTTGLSAASSEKALAATPGLAGFNGGVPMLANVSRTRGVSRRGEAKGAVGTAAAHGSPAQQPRASS